MVICYHVPGIPPLENMDSGILTPSMKQSAKEESDVWKTLLNFFSAGHITLESMSAGELFPLQTLQHFINNIQMILPNADKERRLWRPYRTGTLLVLSESVT